MNEGYDKTERETEVQTALRGMPVFVMFCLGMLFDVVKKSYPAFYFFLCRPWFVEISGSISF